MKEGYIPIYTNFTITQISNVSLRTYFNSIRRNLPSNWKNCHDEKYSGADTLRILEETLCLQLPEFTDTRFNKILSIKIFIGLTLDSIILLRIDVPDYSKEDALPVIGYVNNLFHEKVLKPNKYYTKFNNVFLFGGPNDENWYDKDVRNKRTIKVYSKSDKATFFLGKQSSTVIKNIKFSYDVPNNISVSLNIVKKTSERAKKLYQNILKKEQNANKYSEHNRNDLYDYFEEIQSSIIFSYITVEGLSNAAIPSNYKYTRINEKRIKEILHKENIERWVSTSEKVSEILPKIFKSSDIKSEKFWSKFKELESLRNSIVHQKTIENDTELDEELYKKMLNPNIFEIINSAYAVIDFYYKLDNAHPYFPLGLGIATFKAIEIDSMKKHFKVISD